MDSSKAIRETSPGMFHNGLGDIHCIPEEERDFHEPLHDCECLPVPFVRLGTTVWRHGWEPFKGDEV